MSLPSVHASLTHLVSGQDRNKTAISDAIDALVSAHVHGGKDVFDARVSDLRSAVDNAFLTMDAIHDTARLAVGMPHEPVDRSTKGESQSAEDTAALRAKPRGVRAGVAQGE